VILRALVGLGSQEATDSRGRPTWRDDDIRWDMTPHELQKLKRII
jgi:hypothetical protein